MTEHEESLKTAKRNKRRNLQDQCDKPRRARKAVQETNDVHRTQNATN